MKNQTLLLNLAIYPILLILWMVINHDYNNNQDDFKKSTFAPIKDGTLVEDSFGFQWFWTLDGPSYGDEGSDMAIDNQGNVFLTGHHGGVDMDRDGNLDLEADVIDPFIMKLNWKDKEQRVRMEWVHTASTPGWNKGHRITADFQGGAFLMGRFREEVTFNKNLKIKGGGNNDAYIAHIGSNGKTLWAMPFGGSDQDVLWDITSDNQGNVYILGWGKGPFPIDKKGAKFPNSEQPVSVIFSYNPDGELRWMHIIKDPVGLRFIEISPDGKLFISGEYEGAIDFDQDGIHDLDDPKGINGFLAIYDIEGQFINSWRVGSGPTKVAFTENTDIFLLGAVGPAMEERYGQADFDGDGKADLELKGAGPINAWIGRFSRKGKLVWLRAYDMDRASDIVCDGQRLVMCGSYYGVRDLNEDGIPEKVDRTVDPSKESELAIMVLDPVNGNPLEVFVAPGPGNDHASAVVILPYTNIINVTGYIQLTADFSGDGKANEGWAKCEALGDIFYAEYRYK